jgi:alginate O-acetyltransferase complex protein AlgI
MSLLNIGLFLALGLAVTLLAKFSPKTGWRNPVLLISSILAVYWLQPALPIRGLDFWLPTLVLGLSILGWLLTRSAAQADRRGDWITLALVTATVLALALTRHISVTGILTPSRPPQTWQVLLFLAYLFALVFLSLKIKGNSPKPPAFILSACILLILVIFIYLKSPVLGGMVSSVLRALNRQDVLAASSLDIRWLGFSYIAFRLIHTLRDNLTRRMPAVSLQEYLIYLVFFPAFSAGPIDRVERFVKDLRTPYAPTAAGVLDSGKRLLTGMFKKFAVADSLALIALNSVNAGQVQSSGWMWVLLYAYAFQILLDFSGYTDIAIGLAGLLGIRLPENFKAPYTRPNLTLFWNNWHMTLTQWFRVYFFNPLTRWLRSGGRHLPVWLVIFSTQLATMLLIGLWHGITWNFVLWGAWHGVGLFAHNRWSEWTRQVWTRLETRPLLHRGLTLISVLLTFHYVALGWVWFALPSVSSSWNVFQILFGGGA